MATKPLVSVIIVNYNGKEYLKTCLDSVLMQEKMQDKYEVIIVDNDSNDNSRTFIKRNYPQVTLIENPENTGFAGGNNLGVAHARGKYVALLNNDTKVEPLWLYYLVQRLQSDSRIATVNSKSLLYFPFVQVDIESDVFLRSEFTNSLDFQSVGVAIEEVVTSDPSLQRMIQYYQGFYKQENDYGNQIPIRWTNGSAKLLLAINPHKKVAKYVLTVRAQKNKSKLVTNLKIKIGKQVVIEDVLKAHQVKQYVLELDPHLLKKDLVYEVQNAGNVLFKSGHSRDRGAVVAHNQQYYEIDNAFFNSAQEINSFCGVSVLIRKDVFTKLGGFDESFFMYYEDVDLSLRLRRLGYKLYFEPKSVVYHIHAGSSGEWSPFFIYNVEKNHLAFITKHFPWQVIIFNFVLYLAMFGVSILKMIKWRLSEQWQVFEEWKEKVLTRKKVLHWFLTHFWQFVQFRNQAAVGEKNTLEDIYRESY